MFYSSNVIMSLWTTLVHFPRNNQCTYILETSAGAETPWITTCQATSVPVTC